jgi:poly(hydroxyalkanoate) granule-associated protein
MLLHAQSGQIRIRGTFRKRGRVMASKRKSRKSVSSSAGATQARLLDMLHQVWLAGLGAVARAQRGAPKLFDELKAEGAHMYADTRDSAEKALRGALGDVQATLNARVKQVRGQATDAFENLEKVFQTRVHRALNQIGVPSAEEVEGLSKRIDALNANIDRVAHARAAPARKAAKRRRARKAR